ncbi:MAG: DUF565 domain-containing protein [Scytolyngbya sp. HA4215-MV1]|jgi:hypothetical protein|nr:DUF565 domain-containing protein [Scytolyngbya sp. HA4215-MV1]
MQNTRLNTLVEVITGQFDRWLTNPWRKISVLVIMLLMGNFLGTAISTTTGARADWDIISAGLMVIFIELVSRFTYGNRQVARSTLGEVINALKIGVTYSLFVDAMKLGS